MKICSSCKKLFNGKYYPGNMCQGCYKYFKDGGTVSPLPKNGEIKKDERGYVICHICGRAYKRLGSHVRESHGMTIQEYKREFELCNNSKTTEDTYSKHMSLLAYTNGMPDRLKKSGFETRVKPGEKYLRYGKKARLQECLDKRARNKI